MAALTTLSARIDGIESHYCIHGRLRVDDLTLGSGDATVALPVSKGEQAATFAPLLSAAADSPFGHGGETVVDPKVRIAKHLAAEALTGLEELVPQSILDRVAAELVPDAGSVRCVLHKANFYGVGGHFAKHRDTPRSESQFGSLVVSLPSVYEGGEFVVRHEGEKTSLDWGKAHRSDTRGYYYAPYGVSEQEKRAARKAHLDGLKPRSEIHWVAYVRRADISLVNRGAAAAATRIFPRRRVATPPRVLPRGYSCSPTRGPRRR